MKAVPLPEDYVERVYAGVLGKIIGVYLGRPFEGWTYERILEELGEIEYYVNESKEFKFSGDIGQVKIMEDKHLDSGKGVLLLASDIYEKTIKENK